MNNYIAEANRFMYDDNYVAESEIRVKGTNQVIKMSPAGGQESPMQLKKAALLAQWKDDLKDRQEELKKSKRQDLKDFWQDMIDMTLKQIKNIDSSPFLMPEAKQPMDKNKSIDMKINTIMGAHAKRQQAFNKFEFDILQAKGDKSRIDKAAKKLEDQRLKAFERVKELKAQKTA